MRECSGLLVAFWRSAEQPCHQQLWIVFCSYIVTWNKGSNAGGATAWDWASCAELKSTNIDNIDTWKSNRTTLIKIWYNLLSGPMCNKHVHSTMTRSNRFHCLIGVINKPTMGELWISPVAYTVDLPCQNFLSPQCRNCSRDPDHAQLWIGTLTHHKTKTTWPTGVQKFEVSSISRCRDITWV